jgi:hypothetical protein
MVRSERALALLATAFLLFIMPPGKHLPTAPPSFFPASQLFTTTIASTNNAADFSLSPL